MTLLTKVLFGSALGLGLGLFAPDAPAQASVSVLGANVAHDCYLAAKLEAPVDVGLDLCTRSLATEALDRHDLAGTLVNRGVIYMRQHDFKAAQHDFNEALSLIPALGEAKVNLGGALIGQHHYAEGVAEITQGLTMAPEEPEKAFYNRALGYEGLDDMKSAYLDYVKASELKPGWAAPKTELTRFTVTTKPN